MNKPSHLFSKDRLLTAIGALTLLASPVSQAADFDTNVRAFYRVSAYGVENKNINTAGNVSDQDTGISHVLRIGLDLKDKDTGVALHSSIELAGNRWQGNRHDYGTKVAQFNDTVRSEDIRLDYAFISLPIAEKGKLNIGRQTTSYNNCFLVCEGRRDRVSFLYPLTPTLTGIINYDRNSDTEAFNRIDNGDLIFFGALGKVSRFDVGFLNFHWMHNYKGDMGSQDKPANTPAGHGLHSLSGVHMISTYASTPITDNSKITVGLNYNNNGRVTVPGAEGMIFNKRSLASYVRAEANIDRFTTGLQYIMTKDGGLISPGFDTYSSLINNSPDATSSPTSMYHMGGESGLRKADDQILAAKVGYKATEKLTVSASLGNLKIKRGTNSDDSMFYDLQANYQATKNVRVWATAGLLEKNKVGRLKGNAHLYRDGAPANSNIFGTFADKDILATSLNVVVTF